MEIKLKNEEKFNEMIILYDLNRFSSGIISLFGHEFVENNKDKSIIVINDKEIELCELYHYSQIENNVTIKLKEKEIITDMSYMFAFGLSLSLLSGFSKGNTKNVLNMSYLFYKCFSLKDIPDISNGNKKNVLNFKYIFYVCSSLEFLPDISKGNTSNVTNINTCSIIIHLIFTKYF